MLYPFQLTYHMRHRPGPSLHSNGLKLSCRGRQQEIINQKTFACFKDPAFYPPRHPQGTGHFEVHVYDESRLRAMRARS
jgi:hypothetical protein